MPSVSPPLLGRIPLLFSFVKFAHTLFALPFALLSAVLAARRIPPAGTLGWILIAMVGARSAAMAFNRIADRHVDAKNPRTATRELPSGRLSLGAAWAFCLVSIGVFEVAAWRLNPLAFLLSPVALTVVFGYSLTKRFTWAAHFVLGLALAIAPVGAWIAVAGAFAWLPAVLGLGVLFWVAGFDILYSLQDEEFDRREGLFSVPVWLGARRAMLVSSVCHAFALAFFYGAFVLARGGWVFGFGVVVAGVFLVRQHTLVVPGDLSRIDAAFFTANGWLSAVFFLCGAADVLLAR
ncbi:MAG: putative 4-hydroxybenzoate polyprenyltransferase [Thermoanaerobaculia bacterium]|nr:putative 4-hydroxybenzoate polyprenyltransferase [Thermoanaerobaculia bacterium]